MRVASVEKLILLLLEIRSIHEKTIQKEKKRKEKKRKEKKIKEKTNKNYEFMVLRVHATQ